MLGSSLRQDIDCPNLYFFFVVFLRPSRANAELQRLVRHDRILPNSFQFIIQPTIRRCRPVNLDTDVIKFPPPSKRAAQVKNSWGEKRRSIIKSRRKSEIWV
jgi:hypothetical protein